MKAWTQTNWFHHSSNEIKDPIDKDPSQLYNPFVLIKPAGLYFAENDTWERWCESAGYYTSTVEYKYQLSNPEELKILDSTSTDLNKYLDLDAEAWMKLSPKYNWKKIREDGYDGFYVPEEKVHGYRNNPQESLSWGMYDVSTLVIWNATKCKIKLVSKKNEKVEKEEKLDEWIEIDNKSTVQEILNTKEDKTFDGFRMGGFRFTDKVVVKDGKACIYGIQGPAGPSGPADPSDPSDPSGINN